MKVREAMRQLDQIYQDRRRFSAAQLRNKVRAVHEAVELEDIDRMMRTEAGALKVACLESLLEDDFDFEVTRWDRITESAAALPPSEAGGGGGRGVVNFLFGAAVGALLFGDFE